MGFEIFVKAEKNGFFFGKLILNLKELKNGNEEAALIDIFETNIRTASVTI